MGRRGPLPSKDGVKQPRSETVVALKSIPGGKLERPEVTRAWLPSTVQAWNDYWDSPLVDVVIQPDQKGILRLFDHYNRYELFMEELIERPTMEFHGEIRANPIEMMAYRLEERINKLEDKLGIMPLARHNLKIAVGRAAITADDLNRRHHGRSNKNEDFEVLEGDFEEVN